MPPYPDQDAGRAKRDGAAVVGAVPVRVKQEDRH